MREVRLSRSDEKAAWLSWFLQRLQLLHRTEKSTSISLNLVIVTLWKQLCIITTSTEEISWTQESEKASRTLNSLHRDDWFKYPYQVFTKKKKKREGTITYNYFLNFFFVFLFHEDAQGPQRKISILQSHIVLISEMHQLSEKEISLARHKVIKPTYP